MQEKIINYSALTSNPYSRSLIETGLTLNTNSAFTSYSIFAQFWITSNLALNGKIAPYIDKNELYHYQYIGVNYHSISDENKYSPFSSNIGMHRLIHKAITENDRWFNFGIQYYKAIFNRQFAFHWNNYFTKDETLKTIGITHFIKFLPKLNLNYGMNYYFQNSTFALNLNFGFLL